MLRVHVHTKTHTSTYIHVHVHLYTHVHMYTLRVLVHIYVHVPIQVMREVGWVVFDEIHYMRDKGNETLYSLCHISIYFLIERGVVWEETIILLPDNVHYVFLSATIPNAIHFAEWICHLHKQVQYLNIPV